MKAVSIPPRVLLLGFAIGVVLFAGLYWSLARGGRVPELGVVVLCAAMALAACLGAIAFALRQSGADAAAEQRLMGAQLAAARTATAQLETQIAHDRQWLEAILHDLSDAVMVLDEQFRLLLCNARAHALLAPCGLVGLRRDAGNLVDLAGAGDAFAAARSDGHATAALRLRDGRGPFEARIAWIGDATHGHVYAVTLGGGIGAGDLALARVPARPEFYDFDLVRLREVPAAVALRPLSALAYCVFDLETTGLDIAGDQIVSVGAVRALGTRVLAGETFSTLVDPGRPIPAAATAIHGIDDAAVAGAPAPADAILRLKDFAHDAILVAHNAAFDLSFVRRAAAAGGYAFDNPPFDTLLIARWLFPDLPDHSLDALGKLLGVDPGRRHSALDDARATAAIFAKLLEMCAARGIASYGDLMAASNMALDMRRAAHQLSQAGGP
jgi:DNA polymerase-3 subunit epsilon